MRSPLLFLGLHEERRILERRGILNNASRTKSLGDRRRQMGKSDSKLEIKQIWSSWPTTLSRQMRNA
jgi:hypothetical protein